MPRIGTRKLYFILKNQLLSLGIGRDKLFAIMKANQMRIYPKRNYRVTTNSYHRFHKHADTVTGTSIVRPEQVWVSDITYVGSTKCYNYLALITDAYSKKIVGYEICDNMTATSTLKALQMALKNRVNDHKLIHHSDRGLQYCSGLYTKLLIDNNIDISMTIDGDPYENAIAERINGILKDEFGLGETIPTQNEAIKMVRQAVEIYNTIRPHLSNHYVTPLKMHQQSKITPKLWHKKSRSTLQSAPALIPS